MKYQCQKKLIGNPDEFNEIPMEIELKFNRNINEVLIEIHFNLVEISMKYQFKFQ